uniref:Uncharacterized protein n=1 Tax=Ganoderma boninense TaxID=34458 RepID=A0A5K1K1B3_9APHY|nr:Uncharacterized protein [Ganoderma boninense]
MLLHRYTNISHLVLNAGTATYSHFDYLLYQYDLMRYPTLTVTHPRANIQKTGVLSKDNLGYAWQCNVFGHYCVYRSLQPLLAAYARSSGRPARVIWMSSMDAMPSFDPADDWQLTKTQHSYEGAKFQAESIAAELEHLGIQAREGNLQSPSPPDFVSTDGEVHHLISSPGVVPTNMMTLLGIKLPGYRAGTTAVFWLTRLLGCKHVHMSVYNAAVATVHLALVPLESIPTTHTARDILPTHTKYPPWHLYHNLQTDAVQSLRFGSRSDRWGNEYPGITAVPVWWEDGTRTSAGSCCTSSNVCL